MENNRDILRMELSEINTYVRQHFQQFLTWYSFFLTINYTVLGWFTSLLLTNALKTSKPIIFIALFFLVQILLSYLACRVVRKHFQDSYDRYNEALFVSLTIQNFVVVLTNATHSAMIMCRTPLSRY